MNTLNLTMSSMLAKLILCLITFLFTSSTAQHPLPSDPQFSPDTAAPYMDTFDFVNDGPLEQYSPDKPSYRVLEGTSYMKLGFYNTTPNAYTLALGVSVNNWVWAANPNDPVREGAKLSFKEDGNLVLVDFDGRLVWQTNTSNKGVVRFHFPDYYDGNLVLYDRNNNAVWQSFDHPTDTLFASQYFGPNKLVSRASALGGYYSLVMMPHRLSLYYKSSISKASKPVVYYTQFKTKKTLDRLQFIAYNDYYPSFNQHFMDGTQGRSEVADLSPHPEHPYVIWGTFIRLENDGNLKINIYDEFEQESTYWYHIYSLFKEQGWSRGHQVDSCQLPEKCGAFGVCDNGVCVSCPTPQGLVPWTAGKCVPPKLGGCRPGKRAKYYKVEGVEHFSSKYNKGEGRTTLGLCLEKCNLDCKCAGFFFHLETSKCWIAHDLMTLTKSENPKHFGFVKMSM